MQCKNFILGAPKSRLGGPQPPRVGLAVKIRTISIRDCERLVEAKVIQDMSRACHELVYSW